MPRIFILSLATEDRNRLHLLVARGENWRQRDRAQTLLYLDDGLPTAEVAQLMNIHSRTVGSTRREWFKSGFDSLPDLPKPGAPRKISAEQVENIVAAATAQPLTAPQLLVTHIANGGTPVHLNTLMTALKAAGLVWKRTRHSLKKSRNEEAFRAAQVEIETLRAQAAAGEIVLAYVDEAGFSQVHPNRSAWTPTGKRHLIEAKRGKRLNVLAAMISNGDLFSAKFWETTTASAFSGFMSLLQEHVAKPITVILDNASIHKAKAERHIMELLKKQGVTLYFLPPYSPELNRIELLWHKMKYTWMAPKCRDAKALETDIGEILSNFGSKFTFSF